MLKYVDAKVVFAEIPDEITLAISISGCPCKCKGCHSSYLAEDIGFVLAPATLRGLLLRNKGVTCVAFMGGDAEPKMINGLAKWMRREEFSHIKVAWYSGRQEIPKEIDLWNFDYIKVGPYIEEKGPLTSRETNQRFYRVWHFTNGRSELIDTTHKFWKHETKD